MQEVSYRISEEYKCRSLISASNSELILGTQSLSAINKILMLKYDDESLTLDLIKSFEIPEEVWSLSAGPDGHFCIGTKSGVEIASITESLDIKFKLPLQSRVTSITWNDRMFVSTSSEVHSLDPETQSLKNILSLPGIAVTQIDPHHSFLLAVGYTNNLLIHDSRDFSSRYSFSHAHGNQVLDLDFNPNNPYHLASCGKDYLIKFWDIRKQECLKTINEHSHSVWQIKYNSFHDQLLISASSDNSVALHRVVSASSAPVDESFFEKENDLLVSRVEGFEDSVYACTWVNGDAWHFASVSYDGKVLVTAVPSEEKYKILL